MMLSEENYSVDRIKLLEAIIEIAPLGMFVLSPDGNVRFWSPGAERIFGWKAEEVLGRVLPTVPETLHGEFCELWSTKMRGVSLYGVETTRLRKDGHSVEVRLWSTPLRGADGHVAGQLVVASDITHQQRMETEQEHILEGQGSALAAELSAKRLQRVLESAPDAILEVDNSGRIVMANAETERLFRIPRKTIVGAPIETLLPERFREAHLAHRADYSANAVTRPMGTGLPLFARRQDGSEFPVDVNLSPVESENGCHTVCVVRDQTERHRVREHIRSLNQSLATANDELMERNREVERALRLKSEFLAGVSHELRTPLNAIVGFAELLAESGADQFSEKQKRFLSHVQQGAHRLLTLINDVLDLAKIEAGRLPLRCQNFSLTAALAEVLTATRTMAAVKNISVDNQVIMDIELFGDPARCKEILYNLLTNAIKFTPEGGKVRIEANLAPDGVTLSIKDNGIGIPLSEHAAIFDTFHQASETTKGVREGTGLGLAITKRLIEMHGGSIWLESEPGKGSCFTFRLPLFGPESPFAVQPS